MITREELNTFGLDALIDLEKDKNVKEYIIRTTSGTSGGSPLFLIRNQAREAKYKQQLFSDKEITRIVMFRGAMNSRLSTIVSLLEKKQYTILVVDNRDLNSSLNDLLSDFKPEGLCGFPSFIVRSLTFVHNEEILKNIKAVSFAGEMISSVQEEFFKDKIPNAYTENIYASAEIGYISEIPCGNLPKNHYHPFGGLKVEKIDTGKNNIRELIVSYYLSPSIYVNQYATGDIVRFSDSPCICGNPVTFELLGRKDFDFIKIAGAIFRKEEMERVVNTLNQYIVDFRGEVSEVLVEKIIKGELLLEIIGTERLLEKNEPERFLEKEIAQKLFLTPSRTLCDLINESIFLPLKVRLVKDFAYKHKEIKLRKV